jgi:hypothetical protein
MKLASLIKEQMDIGDVLYSNRDQIELDFGPRTFKTLQSSLMMDDEAYVRNWLIKNGYMEEEKMPFEEMKLSGEKNAEELAAKTKQIASKAGEEMVNFAKDVYDTPTVKRLRAYIKKELGKLGQKLVDKYAVDQPGKQMKIPFDDMNENLRNWFKKEKWKRIDTQGNIAGDCGTMPKGKKTQRCLPAAKARSLSKKQRAATSRKKTRSNKQFVSNTKKAKVKINK